MTNAEELEFWSSRYRDNNTPWDKGGPHPELLAKLNEGSKEVMAPPSGGRALVPGCGRGWDALALAKQGWNVLAVDLVEALKPQLQPALKKAGGRFKVADALAIDEGPFNLIFEHTFYCALPPEKREQWGEMVNRNLAPDGWLVVLVFPTDRPEIDGGPPWKMTASGVLKSLVGKGFELLEETAVREKSPERAWGESWAILRRKSSP